VQGCYVLPDIRDIGILIRKTRWKAGSRETKKEMEGKRYEKYEGNTKVNGTVSLRCLVAVFHISDTERITFTARISKYFVLFVLAWMNTSKHNIKRRALKYLRLGDKAKRKGKRDKQDN